MDSENDDVNIVPFLPLDMLLHLLIRGQGPIIPKMIITPSLLEIQKIRPIKLELSYDFYNRNTFMHFAYIRQEAAYTYGQKLVEKGSIYAFQRLFYHDIEIYYQMAQKLLLERESVRFEPRNTDYWKRMFKIDRLEPIVPTTRRQIWHETVAEMDFIACCKEDVGDKNCIWPDRKLIDCRGALRDWKAIKNSKEAQISKTHVPIDGFRRKEMQEDPKCQLENVANYLQNIQFEDVGDKIIMDFEQELVQKTLESLKKLQQLQAEKRIFSSLDCDKQLLNRRCLPLLHEALNVNQTALRVKEFTENGTQAEYWETEWCDEWSNASVQTMEN